MRREAFTLGLIGLTFPDRLIGDEGIYRQLQKYPAGGIAPKIDPSVSGITPA